MNIENLKSADDPIKVVEAFDRMDVPELLGYEGNFVERQQIYTKIFTDGQVVDVVDRAELEVDDYYINGTKYDKKVDILRNKDVYLKNHSYVIVYLIGQEYGQMGNVAGFFDITLDVNVYLVNAKDKKALREAKKVIKEIQKRNVGINFSSVASMIFSNGVDYNFDCEENMENIYTVKSLKRKKNVI